ncbi:MAG TPA: ABC transporter substrate-binding protein [Natronosporangium sp.]|nr:ABC transporter substrate-binding protein [Natronosporangium sp.]
MKRIRPAGTVAALLALALAGCGDGIATTADSDAASSFPMTIRNCGVEVTIEAPPERVVMLKSAPVTYLQALGVLDQVVVARAGAYPDEYYDAETRAALAEIPLLTDRLDPSGHLQISREVVIAQRPDLVLGAVDNLNHETLAAVGIPVLEEPAMCPGGVPEPSFDDVAAQMRRYGEIFGVPERGEQAATQIEERLAEITARVSPDETRTAAVLYPTVGGGVTYAYGTRSMAHPQLEAAGFTNVFADVDERVFEVSREELIGRNPDVLILLYSDGDPAAVKEAVTSMAGADAITAVANDDILVQLFNFTEPPSPLSLDGLERIVEAFAQ